MKKIIGFVLFALVLISVVGHAAIGTLNEINGELLGGYVLCLIAGIVLIVMDKKNKQ